MKTYTTKALKGAIGAGIGFGIFTGGKGYYDGDDFEFWKFIFKVLFFTIFMGLYFNYRFKKKFEKESK